MAKFHSLEDLGGIKDRFKKENEEVEKEIETNNQEEQQEPKKDIYLLGGRDAEMRVIEKRLKKDNQEYLNKGLEKGAKIQDYSEQISKILEEGDTPVSIELVGAETVEGVVDIDHHDEKSNRPASLLQVMNRIGMRPSFFDKLIAANDSGFIPAMEDEIEEYRSQIENRAGKDVFEELKRKWVRIIRKIDRKEKGITPEQEKQAEEAIKSREDFYNNTLSIVNLPHSKCATVTDRLYKTYENLFIPSADGESNFYGNGKLCQKLKDKYEESWAGGDGLGNESGNAYWGGYPDQDEVEKYIKEETKNISESFSRFNHIFTPENISDFTELGKKLYELGSFDRMNDAIEVSDVEIVDGGASFIIKIKAKDGWNLSSVYKKDLFGGDTRYKEREKNAQDKFGLGSDGSPVPLYVFLQDGEEVPPLIKQGLTEREDISFEKGPYSNGEYYEVIKKFPTVENAIKNELETIDPRLLYHSLGKVDISPQKTWEVSGEGGYYSDHGDASLSETCKDFELLGLGGYSTYTEIEKLKTGNVEIFTPNASASAKDINEWIEKLKQTVEQFESPINRAIQENKIKYLESAHSYIEKEEKELEHMKNDPKFIDQYFAKGSMEKPLEFNEVYEDFEKLNMFLKDKTVALYKVMNYGDDYLEHEEKIGKYSDLELTRSWGTGYGRFSGGSLEKAIKRIDSSVQFSADTFAVDKIIEAVESAGYEVEGRGRSGFKSRNSFVVLLPKETINGHIVKYGKAINGKEVGSEKVWYCGEVPIEINDENKIKEVKKIIENVRQEEKDKQVQEFKDEFISKGDGVTALMETGGSEKYKSIPEGFKALASKRIANTRDHRQNRTHTYSSLLLNIAAIKGKKSITIKVPDDLKGLVIGKGGQNIKRISEELGLFIRIV